MRALGYRRRRTRVLKALAFVLGEARTGWRAEYRAVSSWTDTAGGNLRSQLQLRAVCRVGIVEFVVRPVIAAFLVVLIPECDDVDDGLRVLLLLLLRDAVGL